MSDILGTGATIKFDQINEQAEKQVEQMIAESMAKNKGGFVVLKKDGIEITVMHTPALDLSNLIDTVNSLDGKYTIRERRAFNLDFDYDSIVQDLGNIYYRIEQLKEKCECIIEAERGVNK